MPSPLSSARISGLLSLVLSCWGIVALSLWLLSATGSGMGEPLPSSPRVAPWTPPGAVIGPIWGVLYMLMAVSLWRLNHASGDQVRPAKAVVIALFIACLTYPFYAFDTPARWPGMLGNVIILGLSIAGVRLAWPQERSAAWLLVPTVVWITFATAANLDGARRFGW